MGPTNPGSGTFEGDMHRPSVMHPHNVECACTAHASNECFRRRFEKWYGSAIRLKQQGTGTEPWRI